MSLLRIIAFPISLIYALVVYTRNKLFDIGIFSAKQFKTPTICVGNLSTGGTGKTPMIEYLIRNFQEEFKVAILSRGYRRKSNGYILASKESTVEQLGDEPYQIHSKFPQVVVAVDADRRNGIVQIEKVVFPDVILLDDAFQHRKVKADFNILLTSYETLYIDDWYLPTGNLRDSKSQAKRADFIIVTKCPSNLSSIERLDITKRLLRNNGQHILFSYLKYGNELKSSNNSLTMDALKDRNITVVTGIANPKPLVQYLKNEQMIFNHLAFKDHHFFTSKEIEEFNAMDFILTTEKDYMRLQGKVENMYYIEVSHIFFNNNEEILKNELTHFMKQNS